jgi:hypothetical protein
MYHSTRSKTGEECRRKYGNMKNYATNDEILAEFSTDVTLLSLRRVLPFLIKVFL